MRILITASTYRHIRSFHLPYIEEFRKRGWEVWIGCAYPPENAPYTDAVINLPFRKSMFSPENLKAARILRKEIKERKFDRIITHTSLAAFFTRLAVKGMKNRPCLINVMHGYLFDDNTPFLKKWILLSAEKLVRKETDLLLTMNEWDYALAKKYRLGREIRKIPGMGVDFSRLDSSRLNAEKRHDPEKAIEKISGLSPDPDPKQKRVPKQQATLVQRKTQLGRKYSIPKDAFVLIYAAEFSKRKNQKFLIKAMRLLPDNTVLVLAGEGALLDKCKKLAERMGLRYRNSSSKGEKSSKCQVKKRKAADTYTEGRNQKQNKESLCPLIQVIFLGQVKDMASWYLAADAAVTASRSEGLPFNVMEAMYMGIPVVASAVKGHTDLIRDGETGLLYSFGDEEAFARKVMTLLPDNEGKEAVSVHSSPQDNLRKHLIKEARDQVQSYSLDLVLPEVMRWYLGSEPGGHTESSDTLRNVDSVQN